MERIKVLSLQLFKDIKKIFWYLFCLQLPDFLLQQLKETELVMP